MNGDLLNPLEDEFYPDCNPAEQLINEGFMDWQGNLGEIAKDGVTSLAQTLLPRIRRLSVPERMDDLLLHQRTFYGANIHDLESAKTSYIHLAVVREQNGYSKTEEDLIRDVSMYKTKLEYIGGNKKNKSYGELLVDNQLIISFGTDPDNSTDTFISVCDNPRLVNCLGQLRQSWRESQESQITMTRQKALSALYTTATGAMAGTPSYLLSSGNLLLAAGGAAMGAAAALTGLKLSSDRQEKKYARFDAQRKLLLESVEKESTTVSVNDEQGEICCSSETRVALAEAGLDPSNSVPKMIFEALTDDRYDDLLEVWPHIKFALDQLNGLKTDKSTTHGELNRAKRRNSLANYSRPDEAAPATDALEHLSTQQDLIWHELATALRPIHERAKEGAWNEWEASLTDQMLEMSDDEGTAYKTKLLCIARELWNCISLLNPSDKTTALHAKSWIEDRLSICDGKTDYYQLYAAFYYDWSEQLDTITSEEFRVKYPNL